MALDILGPLPETADRNKYILVVGDYFSKWVEAFAIPNQEAHSVAKVLAEQWICRYGAPRSIHTDQGRNFDSLLFKEMCRLLNITKTRTTPYHPQSDGLIERFNRTVLAMLSMFVNDNQATWDVLLPYVMLAYRSSVQATTGFTPYKVMFGQEVVLPIDIMLNLDSRETFTSASAYVTRLADTLATVVEAVKKHQVNASKQQKAAFDFKANFQYYSEGELVWMRSKARKRGVCPKLQRRFKGPYRILERANEVLYRLVLVEGGAEIVVHFTRLKPFLCSLPEPSIAQARDERAENRPNEPGQPADLPFGPSWVHRRPAPLPQAGPAVRGRQRPGQELRGGRHPAQHTGGGGRPPSYQEPGGRPPSHQEPGGRPPSPQAPGGRPPSHQEPGGRPPSHQEPGGRQQANIATSETPRAVNPSGVSMGSRPLLIPESGSQTSAYPSYPPAQWGDGGIRSETSRGTRPARSTRPPTWTQDYDMSHD